MTRRRTRQPAERRDLTEMALANLRRLFPRSRFLIEYERAHGVVHAFATLASATMRITAGEPRAKRVRTVAMPVIMASTKCAEKGCPFPSIVGQRCRQHAVDLSMERSLVPSPTWTGVSGLRFHA